MQETTIKNRKGVFLNIQKGLTWSCGIPPGT